MPYNTSTGIFTNVSGAVTATAGQTIASATWNSIHTDYGTALTQIGPANLPYINGANNAYFFTKVITANFGAAASDIAVFAISSILPSGITTYSIDTMRIGNAQGSLSGVTITLYTAASAGGSQVVGSTATTVTSSVPGAANSYQIIVPASKNTIMWNSAQLFLHISTSNAAASLANVVLAVSPVY